MIGSTLAALGIGVVAARLPFGSVDALEAADTLDGAAVAMAPAVRLGLVDVPDTPDVPDMPDRLTFPVQLPADLVLLDNFGSARVFGPGAHQGIDIGRRDQQPGQPLVACVDGILVAQELLTGKQGNSWVIQDSNGDGYRYHHLEGFADGLVVGDHVERGQVIGTMGSTGNPIVPHLHFEVRRGGPIGTPVDPVPLLGLPISGVTVG